MKTNIKKYVSKTILLGASLAVLFGGFSVASASAVVPLSSGIKTQFYSIEWCSPQYSRLSGGWGSPCRTGYFSNVGGIAKIVYDGQSFPTGNVAGQANILGTLTRTANTLNAASVIDFFASITGGAFALEGEGVVKIKAYLVDYADNTSYYTVTYKIDKTAPQLAFNGLAENTDYTYYGGRVNTQLNVYKNDSVGDSESGDNFSNPNISLYSGSAAAPRLSHTRPNLHAFYFQNTNSGLGSFSPFTANVTYSDSYSSYLTPSATMSDGSSTPLVAGEKRFYLVPGSGNVMTADLGAPSSTVAINTSQLLDNSLQNSQKYYRLRLFDDTVGADGQATSGNYSETAFYVVRDNTAPNLGGNGLAGTNQTLAAENMLKFSDTDTVYDKTVPGYNPTSGTNYSRFFAANSNLPLSYLISDKGVTGDNTTSGNGCTDYSLCNAGLDTASTTRAKINIEKAAAPGTQETVIEPTDRFDNSGTKYKDFSKSDNGTQASNGTYRYYASQFVTNANPGVCDLVGNCINPNLNFRVVANVLDSSQSKLSVATNSDSTVSGAHKMLANGSDSYAFTYSLRDAYGNKIVPVQSLENSGTPVLKTIDTDANFTNGLAADQRSNSPTGTKLAIAADRESDNSPATNASTIDTTGKVAMREGLSNPNGNYGLSLASKVPTKGFYPYLSSGSVLSVQSIDAQGTGSASSSITYPKASADRLGYFSLTAYSGGNNSALTVPNTGSIGETGGFSNINLNETNYGQYAFSNATNVSFTEMSNLGRNVNFEFASPLVYGLVGFKTLIDGQYMQHYKKLYNIGGLAAGNYNVYEKNLVAYDTDQDEQPGVLNFDIRQAGTTDNMTYNEGVRFTNGAVGTFFSGSPAYKAFDILTASQTGTGYSAEVQMSAIPGHAAYDNTKLRTAFVSGLSYSIGGDIIRIPSVARNISDTSGSALDEYSRARAYYSSAYTIKGSNILPNAPSLAVISNIAVTGLTNRYNSITTDVSGTKANTNVSTEISRSDLTATIKKNIALQSAGFAAAGTAVPTGGKRWCSGTTINQAFLDNAPAECTQVINGETISFVDGNSTLSCGAGTECKVTGKRSIIVQNGYLDIQSNITSLDSSGNQTSGQLFLAVVASGGLANVTIDGNNPDISNADKSGWMLIDPSVTNIDAFLVSQGPAVSYNGTNFFTKSLTTDNQLRNQLHVMGSMLTLNNIGASRLSTPECPYIVNNCNAETAQMFDLVYLRRYTLQSKSIFTGNVGDASILVPYHPDGYNIAKKSGGTTGDEPAVAANCTSNPTDLRCIKDSDYRPYPMLIERDTRWNDDPSVFFQMN